MDDELRVGAVAAGVARRAAVMRNDRPAPFTSGEFSATAEAIGRDEALQRRYLGVSTHAH